MSLHFSQHHVPKEMDDIHTNVHKLHTSGNHYTFVHLLQIQHRKKKSARVFSYIYIYIHTYIMCVHNT